MFSRALNGRLRRSRGKLCSSAGLSGHSGCLGVKVRSRTVLEARNCSCSSTRLNLTASTFSVAPPRLIRQHLWWRFTCRRQGSFGSAPNRAHCRVSFLWGRGDVPRGN
jgi:hypothetical protein